MVLSIDVAFVHRFTVDDSYITLRYSRNVANGVGAVYNATGARAEGYTSFLWMELLALAHLVTPDALVVAKALGVVFTFATCALIGFWAFIETSGRAVRVLAAGAAMAGYAALPRTAIHAVSGMETALFTTLLTSTFFVAARLVRDGPRWAMPFAVLALASAVTRPEASLAVGVVTLGSLLMLPRDAALRTLVTVVLVCALPLVAYELWRLHYYGLPLPLPFYVKLASPGAFAGAEPVMTWLASELRFAIPLVLLLRAPPRHLRPVLAATLSLVLFFVLPQHLMGYDSRYLSPVDPTMCMLFGLGVGRLFGDAPIGFVRNGNVSSPYFSRAAAVIVGFVVPAAFSVVEAPAAFRERLDYADGLAEAHERLGRDLAALHVTNPRLATSDAGAVPYLSGWWTLDLIGLNDAKIATTGSRDPDAILANAPDVLVLISTEPDHFIPYDWNAFELPIYDKALAAGFTRVDLRRFASDYWLWVLVRRGFTARLPGPQLSLTEATGPGTGSAASRSE
ncbi:MAG TPA: hypothetical protein VH062_00965 [Polyangiaceae bacterium]|nr:hypothetical protein [Polyangiaceae bacterium]